LNSSVHLAIALSALAATVILVSGICRRLDLPAPLVLVALGAGVSFIPLVPEVHLSAEVVLIGLLPPLLYAAALQSSLVDFNTNRRAILLLSVGLVAFTTVGVAAVVHTVVPDIGWPQALALGAVLSPPDAVAATSIAKRVGMPRRIVTILEGESLLNDATALVALRTAVLAATASVTVTDIGIDFAMAAVGGILAGLLVYLVVGWVRRRITDPVLDTSVSFVTPFLAYVLAESVHASGVLAVVIAGLLLGHRAPILQTASSRIAERLTWRTISFLLENAVFLLIGLQARWILADVQDSDVSPGTVVALCVASFVAVVLLRLLWVFPARYLLVRPEPDNETGKHPSWGYTLVVGWAGMRGVVTLAAAFAILPWLVRRLRLPSPDAREDALARAALFEKATVAGLEYLDLHRDEEDPFQVADELRRRAEQRNTAAWERLGGTHPDDDTPSEVYAKWRLEMLRVEREKVLQVRSTGTVPSDVISDVLAALDVEDRHPQREAGRGGRGRQRPRSRRDHDVLRAPGARAARHRLRGVRRVRGLHRGGHPDLGAPPSLPGLRAHGLLRLLAAPARHRPLPRERAPRHAVRGTG
jgi:NhaP-type Na+/H+ or K+/H+ antiporter